MSEPTYLVQSALDLRILKILALQTLHGRSPSQRLKQVSGDVLQMSDGLLDPALHKLEQQGSIRAEWKPTENNRRAKFYSLTRSGNRHLEQQAASWELISAQFPAYSGRWRCEDAIRELAVHNSAAFAFGARALPPG